VVVDEAYVEFSRCESLVSRLSRYENLAILRTLSKAYALAGARCGAVLAHPEIIGVLARVITPYALPTHTVESVLKFTDKSHAADAETRIAGILAERDRLTTQLARQAAIIRVWNSDSNFLLVECVNADQVLRAAISVGLIIRDPRANPALSDCVRISVGTPEQNERLLRAIAALPGRAAGDAA
ncbi:MAG: aminotransferase class I/II-fold pyridoxal phosphate-dependent enzyme, partial [Povalibacter sp.]